MPRSTIGGNDPNHELSKREKDDYENNLRKEARESFKKGGSAKDRKELLSRAKNISRLPSKKADHH